MTSLGRRWRAKLLSRRGDLDDAERLGREAATRAARTDYIDLRAQAVADLAEVLRLTGRPEESAAAVQEAIRLHGEKGNVAAAGTLRTRRAVQRKSSAVTSASKSRCREGEDISKEQL